MATILIGADICPIERNRPYFMDGDASSLFNDLLPEMQAADLVLANLECPLIEKPAPIPKTGPNFGEPGECIKGIQAAGIDVLSLANNHILDHGPSGLEHTLKVCRAAGIETVGAGENLAAARQMLIKNANGLRLAILSVAEHEFSIATRSAPGANPLDLMDFVRNVKSRRQEFDYLVVLLHGAHEFHPITPRIQNVCRFMVEMGANAVIVQHPHSLGGYEDYLGGHIVYGQGALVMDEAIYRDQKSFHEGFLVKLSIASGGKSTMELVPFIQSDPCPGARRLDPLREPEFRRALQERSELILQESYVADQWIDFCQARRHGYLSSLLGHNRILRNLNARGALEKLFYGQRRLLGSRNIVTCETHQEALQTIFNQRIV